MDLQEHFCFSPFTLVCALQLEGEGAWVTFPHPPWVWNDATESDARVFPGLRGSVSRSLEKRDSGSLGQKPSK